MTLLDVAERLEGEKSANPDTELADTDAAFDADGDVSATDEAVASDEGDTDNGGWADGVFRDENLVGEDVGDDAESVERHAAKVEQARQDIVRIRATSKLVLGEWFAIDTLGKLIGHRHEEVVRELAIYRERRHAQAKEKAEAEAAKRERDRVAALARLEAANDEGGVEGDKPAATKPASKKPASKKSVAKKASAKPAAKKADTKAAAKKAPAKSATKKSAAKKSPKS